MAPPNGTPKPTTSGRKKGVPNKRTAELQEAVAASGITPLEYMLAVMRDRTAEWSRRDWAAAAAANYVHPRVAAKAPPGEDGEEGIVVIIRKLTAAVGSDE